MRLVSYNILNGGEGRADPLAEVILAQRPDIVAIVEADNLDVLERLATRLGMEYVHGQGRKSAAAVFSRWQIRESINHAALGNSVSKSFLEASVVDPAGIAWCLGVVHLHAHARERDEAKREAEMSYILETFKAKRKALQPHILVGDFNSTSPIQEIVIRRCKKSTRTEFVKNNNVIPRRVVQNLLNKGYLDSLHTFDEVAGRASGTFSTQHPGQRVDFAFTFGVAAQRIQRAWIETDRLAKYASDHFPIGVEIAS